MSQPLPSLIKALLEPSRYPHAVKSVELIETHISWLLLAGEFVYKIKKPITLAFLDYGSLAKRRICCELELRLNRRYAADIYLEMVAITGSPDNPTFNSSETPIEFAVKMRRFDEHGRLDHVCARGELKPAQVAALARTLAVFHQKAATAQLDTRFGSADAVEATMLANFTALKLQLADTEHLTEIDALLAWTQAEFKALTPRLSERKAAGKIRECHGDLHLGNIVLIDGEVRLFDCIEFNDDLRWIDVASDIAFTYVDLIDHQQPALGGWLLNEWLCISGDYDALPILRFYAVYRALVRAKVAAIRCQQNNTEISTEISEVLQYVALASKLTQPNRSRLIITHGLAGCGKSTVASNLLLQDTEGNSIRIRSDVERKRLFGLSATDNSHSNINDHIYSQAAHTKTYARLYELAADLLAAGWSVIVDAAFLKIAERSAFHELATKMGTEFGILAPQASAVELRRRIVARLEQGDDASEATLEVLAQQLVSIEPLSDVERSSLLPLPESTTEGQSPAKT
jgi:aminoglycoside phosphotransferase family enzyme/predicted kinase